MGKKEDKLNEQAQDKTRAKAKQGERVVFETPERERTYVYPNGETMTYRNVRAVRISASGNHYVEAGEDVDGERVFAIVAPGWRAIELGIDGWTF